MGPQQYLHPKEGDAGQQIHRGLEILQPFGTAGREVVLPKGKKGAELHTKLSQERVEGEETVTCCFRPY